MDAFDTFFAGLTPEEQQRLAELQQNAAGVEAGTLGSLYHGSPDVGRDEQLVARAREAVTATEMEAVQGPTESASFGPLGEAGEMARMSAVLVPGAGRAAGAAGVVGTAAAGYLGTAGVEAAHTAMVKAGVPPHVASGLMVGLGLAGLGLGAGSAIARGMAGEPIGTGISEALGAGAREAVGPEAGASPTAITLPGGQVVANVVRPAFQEGEPGLIVVPRGSPRFQRVPETEQVTGSAPAALAITDQPVLPGRTPVGIVRFNEMRPTGDYILEPTSEFEQFVPMRALSAEDLQAFYRARPPAPIDVPEKTLTPDQLASLRGAAAQAEQFTGDRKATYLADVAAQQEPLVYAGGTSLRRAVSYLGTTGRRVVDALERPFAGRRRVMLVPPPEQRRVEALGSGGAEFVQAANAQRAWLGTEAQDIRDMRRAFDQLPPAVQMEVYQDFNRGTRLAEPGTTRLAGPGTPGVRLDLTARSPESAAATKRLFDLYDRYGPDVEPQLPKGLRETQRATAYRDTAEWIALAKDASNPQVQVFALKRLEEITTLRQDRLVKAINDGTLRGMIRRFSPVDFSRQVPPDFLPPPQDLGKSLEGMFLAQAEAASQGRYFGRALDPKTGQVVYTRTARMRQEMRDSLRKEGYTALDQDMAEKWFNDYHAVVTGTADRPFNPGLNIVRSLNILVNAFFGVAKHSTQFATTWLVNPITTARAAVLAAPEDAANFGEFFSRFAAAATERIAQNIHGVEDLPDVLSPRVLDSWTRRMITTDSALASAARKVGVPGLRPVMRITSRAISRNSVATAESYVSMWQDALRTNDPGMASFAARGLGKMGLSREEVATIMDRGQLTLREAKQIAVGMHQRIFQIRPGDIPKLARTNPLAHLAYMFSATPVKIAHETLDAMLTDMQAGNFGGAAKMTLLAPLIGSVPVLTGAAYRSVERMVAHAIFGSPDDPLAPFGRLPVAGGSQEVAGVRLTPSAPFAPDAFVLQAIQNSGITLGTHALGLVVERLASLMHAGLGDPTALRRAWGPEANFWQDFVDAGKNAAEAWQELGVGGALPAAIHFMANEALSLLRNTAQGGALREEPRRLPRPARAPRPASRR